MTPFSFDAPVTAVLFDASGQAAFALGDGTVRFEDGTVAEVHDGAVLSACAHPSGAGIITGGDDGRVVWSRPDQAQELADMPGKWIDAVASSSASGLVALASGRTVTVLDIADPHFRRDFTHERSVSDIAFEPKGRKLASATYGGVATWFARIERQKPTVLKWAGSHTRVAYSPDGAFLISAMQENQLHGWRLKDSKDLRMGGYPSKIRDMAFFDQGRLMRPRGPTEPSSGPSSGPAAPWARKLPKSAMRKAAWSCVSPPRRPVRCWRRVWPTVGSGLWMSAPARTAGSGPTRARPSRPWPCARTAAAWPGATKAARPQSSICDLLKKRRSR